MPILGDSELNQIEGRVPKAPHDMSLQRDQSNDLMLEVGEYT
jgi:hypothetical protein